MSSDLNYPSIPKQEALAIANYMGEQLDYLDEQGYQKMNSQNLDLFNQMKSIHKLVDIFTNYPQSDLSFTLSPLAKPNSQHLIPDSAVPTTEQLNQLAVKAAS